MKTRAIPRSWATGLAAVALLISGAVPATVGAASPVTPLCHGLPATIVGTPGQSAIRGTQGADVIVGLEVGVRIDGRGGDDTICAGAGDNIVNAGPGNDWIDAGDGNNTTAPRTSIPATVAPA